MMLARPQDKCKANSMVRGALGIVVGAIAWMVAFFAVARLLFLMSPAYAAHAQTWMSAQVYEFTAPESGFHVLLWILAEIFAGWLTVVIAKRREASWILAALIGLYMAFMHLYYVWDSFPWWYNLAVVIPVVPAVLFGGKLAGRFARPSPTVAAG
ncbi:MAG TPA: hypothetical protein VIM81_02695 [Gammaproteobacteria bacterium]